jgi:hypothetical protein
MITIHAGDRLESPKQNANFITHHVLFVGVVNGTHQVVENQINIGVRLIPFEAFRKEHPNFTHIPFNGNIEARNDVVIKALNSIGKPYKLLSYNCETFANDVQFDMLISHQVNRILKGIGLFLGGLIIIKGIRNNL